MEFLEKDLEQIIWESSNEQLEEAGISISGSKRFRQLKIGNYGIADLVVLDRTNAYDFKKHQTSTSLNYITIKVCELKKDAIGIAAFLQAVRYVKGIKRYIEHRGLFSDCNVSYEIVLVGRTIDASGAFIYLPDIVNGSFDFFVENFHEEKSLYLSYYTYDYKIDGLKFKSHYNYMLTEEGF